MGRVVGSVGMHYRHRKKTYLLYLFGIDSLVCLFLCMLLIELFISYFLSRRPNSGNASNTSEQKTLFSFVGNTGLSQVIVVDRSDTDRTTITTVIVYIIANITTTYVLPVLILGMLLGGWFAFGDARKRLRHRCRRWDNIFVPVLSIYLPVWIVLLIYMPYRRRQTGSRKVVTLPS